jgi:HSP20 family protein
MKQQLFLKKKHSRPQLSKQLVPPPWPPPDGFPQTPGIRYGYVWWPPVDIAETGEKYVFTADLTRTKESVVEVDLVGDEIMVSGTAGAAPFAFAIALPQPVDADDVEAELENGVLVVTVPMSASTRHHKVELKD